MSVKRRHAALALGADHTVSIDEPSPADAVTAEGGNPSEHRRDAAAPGSQGVMTERMRLMAGDDARPGFNHNDFYHRYLLRQVPVGCDRALDVGCGTGRFARRLARHAGSVEALDRDAEVIAQARALSGGTPNVRYINADLGTYDLTGPDYGYISCIASIHHLPFAETVDRLRAALAP